MPEVWGLLPKSQIDDELIEEAIARLILEHNADETAHLGVGQSLQSHKASEIIDHVVGSIVADKISSTQGLMFFVFESLDNYGKSSTGVSVSLGGFKLETGTTLGTEKHLYANGQYSPSYYDIGKDCVFQFTAIFDSVAQALVYALAGGDGTVIEPPGIGFKINNGVLYAVETVWNDEAIDEYTSEITGITLTSSHVYRVQTIASENKAYFYIDGVLKTNLTLHTNTDVGLRLFIFSIKNQQNGSNYYARFSSVYLSVYP